MPINKVSSFSEVLFTGPAPATGSSFLNISGDSTTYPIFLWPQNGIKPFGEISQTVEGPFDNVFGKNDVYKITDSALVAYHGITSVPNFGVSGTTIKALLNVDYYLPSSNQWMKALYIIQQASSYAFITSGYDRWVNFKRLVDIPLGADGATKQLNFLGYSVPPNVPIPGQPHYYTGNGTDFYYMKDYSITTLSGQNESSYFNLIRPFNKVQSINYSFNIDRQDLTQLGNPGTVYQPIVNLPTVTLDFETLTESFENEFKAGLTVNFNSFFSGSNGAAFFTGFRCPLSGFETRCLSGLDETDGLVFPRLYTDKRNFYIKTAPQGRFFESMSENDQLTGCSSTAFGNCYLTNYKNSAQVGDFVRSNFSYICENFTVNNSPIGVNPALSARDGNQISGSYYILPTYSGIDSPVSVVRPQDVIIAISGINDYDGFLSIGANENDLKFQSYDLEVNLSREPLESLGYKLPIDRVINYPVFATLNIQALVGDFDVSNINDFVFNDNNYNIDITLNNKCQFTAPNNYKNIVGKFFFRGAKMTNAGYNESIEGFKTVNFSFSQEMNPLDFYKGMFMSGVVFGRQMPRIVNLNNAPLHSADFFHFSGSNIFTNGYF